MSRTLHSCEKQYPAVEKEATPVIEAVRRWSHLLEGSAAIGNPERHVRKASHRGSKQQEIMLAISLAIACSRYIYYGVILHAHPVRGESHIQRNTTGEVATADTSRSSLIRERSRWYSANVTEAKLGIPKSSPGDLN